MNNDRVVSRLGKTNTVLGGKLLKLDELAPNALSVHPSRLLCNSADGGAAAEINTTNRGRLARRSPSMIRSRSRSLQFRVAGPRGGSLHGRIAVAARILIYQAYDTAGAPSIAVNSARSRTSDDISHWIRKAQAQLDLPSKLAAAYETASGADIFVRRGGRGQIIAASPSTFGELVAGWPVATDEPSYFHLNDFRSGSQDYTV